MKIMVQAQFDIFVITSNTLQDKIRGRVIFPHSFPTSLKFYSHAQTKKIF